VLHAGANGDSDCLAERNAETVCPDAPPTNGSGSQFSYVKRAYSGRPTHSDTKDKPTSDELAKRETHCDDDAIQEDTFSPRVLLVFKTGL
jgi:hypothetical protein